MAVYRNLVVDIPKERVTIEKQNGGKPALIKYVLEAPYDRTKGYATPKRTTIGHQCIDSTTTMHPTTQYAQIFPTQWEKISNETAKPAVKRIGMFAACQAISEKTGLRDILDHVFGTDHSSAILDYAMYSILHHSDDASSFPSRMRNELTYTGTPRSDTYYAQFFEKGMPREAELLFRRKWAVRCREEGADTAWLCIDGSNDDCQSKGVELAEKGHAKSGKNVNIVSFTYAVTAEGKPITYDIYRGGLVDAKAMRTLLDFMDECGIRVKGVILDRGYCTEASIRYLAEHGIAYVIMIKGKPTGYEEILVDCGQKIKMNAEYLIPHTFLFGCQKRIRLFKNSKHRDYITLFFDYRNGSERITTLLKNLYNEIARIEGCIQKGEMPAVDSKYQTLLAITGEERKQVAIQTSALQASIDEKGLYGIVTSTEMTPQEVHRLYVSRSSSETQYRIIKTQLGYGTLRAHNTAGIRTRFSIGFVASILRYEMEIATKQTDRNVNQMVQELEKIEIQKLNAVYTYTHTETDRMKAFFRNMQASCAEQIDASVQFANDMLAGRIQTPRHRKTGPKKGSHRKRYDEQGNVVPRKPGVKTGTKRNDTNQDGTSRKKPGVAPGTKRGTFNKDGSLRKSRSPSTN